MSTDTDDADHDRFQYCTACGYEGASDRDDCPQCGSVRQFHDGGIVL